MNTRGSAVVMVLLGFGAFGCRGTQDSGSTGSPPGAAAASGETAGDSLAAQDPGPDVFPAPDAVSAFVRRIFQDERGDLWLGTNGDGVARFDGRSLAYYSIPEGFGGLAVRGIAGDRNGAVWFATSGGVTRYDGESFVNFTVRDGLNHDDVWSLLVDHGGTVWAGTYDGACRFDGTRFVPFEIPPAAATDPRRGVSGPRMVRNIMEDRAGNLWFATEGGVYEYDGETLSNISETRHLGDLSVNCMVEDREGRIWLATHFRGVWRLDGGSLVNVSEQEGLKGTEVWSLYRDPAGNIWFPVEGAGLYRYDGESFTEFYGEEGLDSPGIQCAFQDREGRLWAGGYLGLYRREGDAFVKVAKDGPW